jgi:23S rRNA-/tRNA-specific pseudouridylate synthase
MYLWTEEWIERLTKGAASNRVDMKPGFHIIVGDHTLIIINKHPHLLVLSSARETDSRVTLKYQRVLVVVESPKTRLRG